MKTLLPLLLLTGLAVAQPIPPPPTPGAVTCGSTSLTLCYNNAGAFGGATGTYWKESSSALGLGTIDPTTYDAALSALLGVTVTTNLGVAHDISGSDNGQALLLRSAGTGAKTALNFMGSGGTIASPTAVSDGGDLSDLFAFAYDGAAWNLVGQIKMLGQGSGGNAGKRGEVLLRAERIGGSPDHASIDIDGSASPPAISTQGVLSNDTSFTAPLYLTTTNCADPAGAAACGAAPAGAFVVDAASTATVVSTTAVTATSRIFIQEDSSLGTELGITCNTQSALIVGPGRVTARTAGTSFTFTLEVGPTATPACFTFFIVN